jgi:uncharacterized membrane protein YeaQ/YmgE (transglycosylase-associated protein family)
MEILWMILVGLAVGALAKLLMPGRDPGGIFITIGLGIAGSLIAGFLGRALNWYEPGQGAGFIASVLGAMLLLGIYRAIRGRHAAGDRGRGAGHSPRGRPHQARQAPTRP